MGQLIDLCGTPIQLEKVKNFRLVKRECLLCPAYQETEEQTFSLFARLGASNKKKFRFTKMVPFGALLSDKEKPSTGSYEIKSFGEAVALNALTEIGKAIGNVAGIAADLLRIDTSGNKEFQVLTPGRRLTSVKLRDIPAKVQFLSGKVSDVYKNDPIYEYLGEPISPTVVAIPTLVVTVEKATYVFFGGGIDLEDAEATYRSLFDAYNQYQATADKKKSQGLLPKININIPKISLPVLNIKLPFSANKTETVESPQTETATTPQGLSINDDSAHALEENNTHLE